MLVCDQIIFEAQKWLNVREQGKNDGPEVREWLKRVNRAPGNAWCAAFAWCMLDDACKALKIKNTFPPIAGAWLMLNQAKKMGAWTDSPGKGFIFGIDHGLNAAGARIGHVGIVADVFEDYVETVEGNGLPLEANVLTPTGWKQIQHLKVGEQVIDPQGSLSVVTGIYLQGIRDVYELAFTDGTKIVADGQHRWEFLRGNTRADSKKTIITTLEAIEILKQLSNKNERLFLPQILPQDLYSIDTELPLDPYLLGLLLGDGGLTNRSVIKFTTCDQEILNNISAVLPKNCRLSQISKYDWGIPGGDLNKIIKSLGLKVTSHYKFIPEQYKWSPVSVRREILRGLMDTDGTVDKQGRCSYTSVSERLAKDVLFLVQSLGGKAGWYHRKNIYYTSPTQKTPKKASDAFELKNIRFPDKWIPFKLGRKAQRCSLRKSEKMVGWGLRSITPVGSTETICISVSAPSGLYITDNFIPTHNTNSAGSREGDGVYAKTRKLSEITLGYFHPGAILF